MVFTDEKLSLYETERLCQNHSECGEAGIQIPPWLTPQQMLKYPLKSKRILEICKLVHSF